MAMETPVESDSERVKSEHKTAWYRAAPFAIGAFLATNLAFSVVLAFNSAFVMDEYWMVVHGLFNIDHLYKEI